MWPDRRRRHSRAQRSGSRPCWACPRAARRWACMRAVRCTAKKGSIFRTWSRSCSTSSTACARSAAKPSPLDARALLDHVNIPPSSSHSRRHGAAGRGRSPLPRVRSRDRAGRRHRRAASGHRPQRPHRLQRAVPRHERRTRLCTLDPVTRRTLASDFFGEENVPHAGDHDGPGHDLRRPQGRADGARRAQGQHHPRGGRRAGLAARAGHVSAGACRRHACSSIAAAGSELDQRPDAVGRWAVSNGPTR